MGTCSEGVVGLALGVQGCLAHKNTPLSGPYSRSIPRVLYSDPGGGGVILMSEVPLHVHAWMPTSFHQSQSPQLLLSCEKCRGTSLIRNRLPSGPYSKALLRALWKSSGGGRFLVNEVPGVCTHTSHQAPSGFFLKDSCFLCMYFDPRVRKHASGLACEGPPVKNKPIHTMVSARTWVARS